MLKKISIALCAAIVCTSFGASESHAEAPYLRPLRRAQMSNWNGNYSHAEYGQPVALVVPPTATMQTNWSWGSPSASFSRIDHQFGRNYSGPGSYAGGFRPTPRWPSNMQQFGVYYARAPWYPTQR